MRIPTFFRRYSVWIVSSLIGIVAIWAVSQQSDVVLSIEKVMNKEEIHETGIDSLKPAQRAALDAWLNRYTKRVIRTVRKVDSAAAVGSRSSCEPAIESSISGDFNGWDGETVFKLSNGQIWEQAEMDMMSSYSYMPDITIYSTSGGCRMKVEDEDETILVKRIR